MTPTLPPGLTAHDLAVAVKELRRVLGDRWVLTDPADLARYRDPFAVLDPERLAPSVVVRAGSVDDVRAALQVARDAGLPLWPVSAGRNLGYGGPAPRLPGAAVLDLGRMDRVLEVDATCGYAVVEPGVTYLDLHRHLVERDVPFWLDVPDLGWGSVVGNTLERGVGYTPYGDHFAAQCGMEVVLADGDVVRTGMGALPGSTTAHVSPYGFGPLYDGLFTQSNFGVVTKMGTWLLPRPPAYQAYLVTLPREEDLGPFVDLLRPLRLAGTVSNVPTLRSVLLDAAAVAPEPTGGRVPARSPTASCGASATSSASACGTSTARCTARRPPSRSRRRCCATPSRPSPAPASTSPGSTTTPSWQRAPR